MLSRASARGSIVWCQIDLCSLPAQASVHDGSFDTLGGRETETVEMPGLSSARQCGSEYDILCGACSPCW
jgi:hypothetical protein